MRSCTWLFLFCSASGGALAQQEGDSTEKPYLIIEGHPVTRTEYMEAVFEAYHLQHQEKFISEFLIRQKAAELGVTVTDQELAAKVDEHFRLLLDGRFRGNVIEMERSLEREGLSLDAYRKQLASTFLPDMLAERILRRNRTVTDEEIFQAFEERYGPGGVLRTVRHILFATDVNRSTEYTMQDYQKEKPVLDREAQKTAERIRQRALAGEDFAELAREFSDDFTAERGGDVGTMWERRFGPEFDEAVASLEPGDVSPVVLSRRGAHVIRVEGIQEGYDIEAMHILLGAQLRAIQDELHRKQKEAESTAKAKELLERLRREPQAFDELARQMSEDPVSKLQGGRMGVFPRGRYGDEVEDALLSLEPGELYPEPVASRLGVHILKLLRKERRPEMDRKRVRHILVSTEFFKVRERKLRPKLEREAYAKAVAVFEELRGGADFAKLVREHSDDTYTKTTGGTISSYNPNLYGPEFAEAVRRLQPGDVGRIVKSPRGIHIVQVVDVTETDLAQVRDQLYAELLEKAVSPAEIRQFRDDLRRSATVVKDP